MRKGNAIKTEGRLILDLGSIAKPPLGIGLPALLILQNNQWGVWTLYGIKKFQL